MRIIVVIIIIGLWLSGQALAAPISYQGQLRQQDQPFSGTANLEFRLFTAASGGSQIGPVQTRNGVSVQEGLFQVELDFGAGAFDGSLRFLEVRVNGTALSPRQAVSFAPQATIASTTVAGAIGSSQINPVQVQQRVTGTCPVGQYVRSVNQNGTVVCGTDDAGWRLAGNAGTNPSNQFVGTTDGQPLVLRSTAGVGINTAGVRGMLTVRCPDDFQAGPVLHLAGNSPSQFESGRIRFVNGTAAGNYRGFYLHYDGAGNFFHIGGRDSTNQDPAEDRNIITIRRSLPNRVGIGVSNPVDTLDVAGDVGVVGRIKFKGSTLHYITLSHRSFSNPVHTGRCAFRGGGIAKAPFQSLFCSVSHAVQFPHSARIRQIEARIFQAAGASGCSAVLGVWNFTDFPPAPFQFQASASANTGGSDRTITVASELGQVNFNNQTQVALAAMSSSDDDCAIIQMRIAYELPSGFLP